MDFVYDLFVKVLHTSVTLRSHNRAKRWDPSLMAYAPVGRGLSVCDSKGDEVGVKSIPLGFYVSLLLSLTFNVYTSLDSSFKSPFLGHPTSLDGP